MHVQAPPSQQAPPAINIVAVEQLLRAYGCAANVRGDERGEVVATAANPRMQAEVDRRLQEVLRMKVNTETSKGSALTTYKLAPSPRHQGCFPTSIAFWVISALRARRA